MQAGRRGQRHRATTTERARWISERERAYILAERGDSVAPDAGAGTIVVRPMSVRRLIRQRPMLGILLANGAQTYVVYFLLTWLPTYLIAEEQLKLPKTGLLISGIYLIAIVGTLVIGKLSDRFLSLDRRQALLGNRRLVVGSLMLVGFLPLVMVTWINGLPVLVFTISITLMAVTSSIVLTFALTNDLIVDNASSGRTFGLVSFGGEIIGLCAPIVTGYIVQASGYSPVFLVAGAVLLVGTVAVFLMPTRALQPLETALPLESTSEKVAL